MNIIQRLIPPEYKKTRSRIYMKPKYITIHETDNYSDGANALAHARLQERGNNRVASWHYTCGSDGIYQSIPDYEIAFHAGDGHGPGNMESIAIEICVNQDGDFNKAKANAVELIRHLMQKHGIPIERVVPHQKWSGKNCPRQILKSGWSAFVLEIIKKKPESPKWPGYIIRKGSRGEPVKTIQKRLGGLVVDGAFGKLTEAAVINFQKKQKINGDGIVGEITWSKLFP